MIIPLVAVLIIFALSVVMLFVLTGVVRWCTGEGPNGNISVTHCTEPTEQQKREVVKAIEDVLPDIHVNCDEELTCPVCLDEIGRDDAAKVLNCKHYFHSECFMTWCTKRLEKKEGMKFKHSISCPLCRSIHLLEVPKEQPQPESFSGVNDPVPEEIV